MKLIFVIPILLIAITIIINKRHHKKKLATQIQKSKADDVMLCPNCQTGLDSYKLDSSSEICPYISCLRDGKCKRYIRIK